MKEPYVEVSAKHNGHESCAGIQEATREAFDSGMYRLGIEPRKDSLECRRRSGAWKATPASIDKRDVDGLYVVGDPTHVQKLFARESGDPVIGLGHFTIKVRIENPIGAHQ